MKVFRICSALHGRSRAMAFNGEGGLDAPGRWHTRGKIIYTAESLSLAGLEMLVHLKSTVALAAFVYFIAEIPDKLIHRPSEYPNGWKTNRSVSRRFGDAWLAARSTPALRVPSVITPGEWNVLLNPLHPAFTLQWITDGPLAYLFDQRLLRHA